MSECVSVCVHHHTFIIRRVSACVNLILSLPPRYLLFMKMAALQLMQQKANKDTKTDTPAITEASETTSESNADTAQTQTTESDSSSAAEVSTDNTSQTDNSTSAASQAVTDSEENSSKPTTNGPLDLTTTQNGECKSPLEGKELEESIPGLAQAKELAETLVAEDGSCIGMSQNTPKQYDQDDARKATLVDNSVENVVRALVFVSVCSIAAVKYWVVVASFHQTSCPCSVLSLQWGTVLAPDQPVSHCHSLRCPRCGI